MPDWRSALRAARAAPVFESAPPGSTELRVPHGGSSRLVRDRRSGFLNFVFLNSNGHQASVDRASNLISPTAPRQAAREDAPASIESDRQPGLAGRDARSSVRSIAARVCNNFVTDSFPSSESYCQRSESLLKEMGRSYFSIEITPSESRSSRRRLNDSRPRIS